MSRRIRSKGANVSFFAFQDIITAVTGILILIVILMVLMLRTFCRTEPTVTETRSLAEIEQLIQKAISKIKEFATVDFNIGDESIEELELVLVEEELESEGDSLHLVSKEGCGPRITPTTLCRGKWIRNALQRTFQSLRQFYRRKLSFRASTTPQLWLKMSVTDKAPIPFEVSSKGIIQRSLEDPEFKLAVRPENISQHLRDIAKDADSSTDYYVFFIRPSGITYVDEIESLVAQEGFDLGLRPLAEELELKIYNEETLDFTP